MNSPLWAIVWVATGAATVVAAVWTVRGKGRRALLLGRGSLGALFVAGGALVHVVNLATGVSYANFADPAHFSWVSHAWRSVVAPNQDFFISVLALFELMVGILIWSGGRKTLAGLAAAIAFHATLWIFGWIETAWCAFLLPPLVVLALGELRARRSAVATVPAPEEAPAEAAA